MLRRLTAFKPAFVAVLTGIFAPVVACAYGPQGLPVTLVQGKVVGADTQAPLPQIAISCDLGEATSTDEAGAFVLEVITGDGTVPSGTEVLCHFSDQDEAVNGSYQGLEQTFVYDPEDTSIKVVELLPVEGG